MYYTNLSLNSEDENSMTSSFRYVLIRMISYSCQELDCHLDDDGFIRLDVEQEIVEYLGVDVC